MLFTVVIENLQSKHQRAPVVAKCDRSRVLSSWAPYCGNLVPAEVQIEFSSVRHLTPQQFVEKLSKELGAVAGENYRFGYKAAGRGCAKSKACGLTLQVQ